MQTHKAQTSWKNKSAQSEAWPLNENEIIVYISCNNTHKYIYERQLFVFLWKGLL